MKLYINNLLSSLHQRSEKELQQSIEKLCKYLVIKSEESASQTIMADSYALRYEAGTLYIQCANDPLPIALADFHDADILLRILRSLIPQVEQIIRSEEELCNLHFTEKLNKLQTFCVEEIMAIQSVIRDDATKRQAYLRAIVEAGAIEQVCLMSGSDYEWLHQRSAEGDVYATCCMLWGLNHHATARNDELPANEQGITLSVARFTEAEGAVFGGKFQSDSVKKMSNRFASTCRLDIYSRIVGTLTNHELQLLSQCSQYAEYDDSCFQNELARRNNP
jgi:hypothetical protein